VPETSSRAARKARSKRKPLGRLLRTASRRLRGVRVSALVGMSGTGKSFRARLIAEKHGIDVIVDDGILIHDETILAGHWAKKERSLLAATRRALFDSPEHAREAREALRSLPFRTVLVVATSRRMAERIASVLDLPKPTTVYAVEEVARSNDIEAAGRRRRAGSHALPAQTASIRRGPIASLAAGADSLADAVRRKAARDRKPRADVDRQKQARGGVAISVEALRQMVGHCVTEHDPRITVERFRVRERGGMHELEIGIGIPFARGTSGDLHRLREDIMHSLERYAGIVVREVRLVVDSVES
jgi:hypothetical protein